MPSVSTVGIVVESRESPFSQWSMQTFRCFSGYNGDKFPIGVHCQCSIIGKPEMTLTSHIFPSINTNAVDRLLRRKCHSPTATNWRSGPILPFTETLAPEPINCRQLNGRRPSFVASQSQRSANGPLATRLHCRFHSTRPVWGATKAQAASR